MTDITKLARGRNCEIRAPGGCTSTETTVPCHARIPDISGLGLKAPDWMIAFGCHHCHDIVDGRAGKFPQYERDLMLLEGVMRTLVILFNEGVISIPEVQKRQKKLTKIFRRAP